MSGNRRFENVLLKLWRELPHDLIIGRERSRQSIETLRRYDIPLGVPESAAAGTFAIAEFAARDYACARWAWAIPDEKAIAVLVRYSPIVEIGAGTGYWARLAAEAGADVVAYDSRVGRTGRRRTRRGRYWGARCGAYFPVRRGGSNMARYHAGRTLFLCWPPYNTPMAEYALAHYEGSTLIYVGENGGCTANDAFHRMLERGWETAEVICIPRWHGLHDRMYVLERRR